MAFPFILIAMIKAGKALKDRKRVEQILIIFVSFTSGVALMHILCNSSHDAKYRRQE